MQDCEDADRLATHLIYDDVKSAANNQLACLRVAPWTSHLGEVDQDFYRVDYSRFLSFGSFRILPVYVFNGICKLRLCQLRPLKPQRRFFFRFFASSSILATSS